MNQMIKGTYQPSKEDEKDFEIIEEKDGRKRLIFKNSN
jgi:hypothetical protein